MGDICELYHKGNQESVEAHKAIAPHTATIRAQIVEFLGEHPGGLIVEEIERALKLKNQTASPRCSELGHMGVIAPLTVEGKIRRRKTVSGCSARVLGLTGKSLEQGELEWPAIQRRMRGE